MAKIYVAATSLKSLSFLNGYSCKSKSEDHFIRHLGFRFGSLCTIGELNQAHHCGELSVSLSKKKKIFGLPVAINKPKVIDEYWGFFGYILKVEYNENSSIEHVFVDEIEAKEWIDSYE